MAAGAWAGAQNALAGGGSFVTLPALILGGIDARAANITSTVALFPGQVLTGWRGRGGVAGAPGVGVRALVGLSFVGGAAGAGLLLVTPSAVFAAMLPWLVLAATLLFAYGSFGAGVRADGGARLGRSGTMAAQFAIGVYGGFFGGGIGFLMLAALTLAGLAVRPAAATKNVLAAVMNLSAVAVFLFSGAVAWRAAAALGAGALAGGWVGSALLARVPERGLRAGIVVLGLALCAGLFWRG